MARKAKDVITYQFHKWTRSHSFAKSEARRLRGKGYFAYIEPSGVGWYVWRSEKKRAQIK